MKKSVILVLTAVLVLSSCSKPKGFLVGVYSKAKPETTPYGMVFIPRGSFNMGPNDQSITWSMQPKQKTVSIDAFWMDQTEITNGEYRQFVNWVRDSIALTFLSRMSEETEAAKYFTTVKIYGQEEEDTILNWKAKIPWTVKWKEGDNIAEETYEAINQMYFNGQDRIEGRELNTRILNYSYEWVNYDQAALPINQFNPYTSSYHKNARVRIDSSFMRNGAIVDTIIVKPLRHRRDLVSSRIINIYPDTMCWIAEFTYSFNEPAMQNYFAHPSNGEYPVVGISWDQAHAFCHWRTQLYKSVPNLPRAQEYRLPTEAEWEYAARGGRNSAQYPWGGPYVRDARGCFMANFKPMRGNYTEDGYLIPCRTASFDPNDYGLFDMAGNVSEWTSTTYEATAHTFTLDMNPHYEYKSKSDDPEILRRKVIRGGSWKDIGAFLQCGYRDFEYQTKRRASIGFRCVRSYIGE
ncbi:MAG: SUMF1/EgtB/PvdO family nonheme iron enzyme [Bacteroidota bacterium]|nr:SUMF1/EgtB/PvdO family nonheme iron enzyme [Bacteroidota bacterium]